MDIILLIIVFVAGLLCGGFVAKSLFKTHSFESEFKEEREKNETLNRKIGELTLFKEKYNEDEERFKLLTSELVKNSSKELAETNQKELNHILAPLRERIEIFEKKIEATKEEGIKNTTALKTEIKGLSELSNRVSIDANNLAQALRSNSKIQGDWGEHILETLLEHSGLKKNLHYFTQKGYKPEDSNQAVKPDVVINLPEDKHIIVDSKLTLKSFVDYTNEEEKTKKEAYLKEFINNVENHIKELNSRHYSNLKGINSPDFVLMFLPIENIFNLTLNEKKDLQTIAWQHKIILTSPSTLLAALKTISYFFVRQDQAQNVKDIADQGGALYDGLCLLFEKLIKVKTNFTTAQDSFNKVFTSLEGPQNVIKRAEKLKELGANTKKTLPKELSGKSDTKELEVV